MPYPAYRLPVISLITSAFLAHSQTSRQELSIIVPSCREGTSMKQIRMLAQYYVDLMMKLGLVRFSLLLALALVVLAIVVQMAVTMVLHGRRKH